MEVCGFYAGFFMVICFLSPKPGGFGRGSERVGGGGGLQRILPGIMRSVSGYSSISSTTSFLGAIKELISGYSYCFLKLSTEETSLI